MWFESENTEFKVRLYDEIYKEVVAFADTDGGVIYLGVSDRGEMVSLENVDETYTRLTNGIWDAIQPDVTMFVRYLMQEERVIRIEVGEGSCYKPYYKASDGDQFEDMRTMQQDLTFEKAEQAFARYGVALFSEEKFIALVLHNLHDDRYTNLALLLSDQCQHTIKVAVFADEARTVFKDAKEFGGSLFRQLEDTYSYL